MSERFAVVDYKTLLPGGLTPTKLLDGQCAIRALPDGLPVSVGAPVVLSLPIPKGWPFPMAPRALAMAADCLARLDLDPKRPCGLVLGFPNTYSEPTYMEHVLAHRDDPNTLSDLLGFDDHHLLSFLADAVGAGPRLRLDAACATGNDCLVVAHQWLTAGLVDDVIVVAATAMLNPIGLGLFHNLKALSDQRDPHAGGPFDALRRGFVMGEGAAALWLSKKPPRRPKGYLCGYGQSMSASSWVDLPEDVAPLERAARAALGNVEEVAWVCAHGTGTRNGDLAEARLHHRLFGDRANKVPISSVKSMIGHTLGAAAAIEACVCLQALAQGQAPPTIHHHLPDPALDLDVVPNQPRKIQGAYALSHAFAFGGHNCSVLFAGADT